MPAGAVRTPRMLAWEDACIDACKSMPFPSRCACVQDAANDEAALAPSWHRSVPGLKGWARDLPGIQRPKDVVQLRALQHVLPHKLTCRPRGAEAQHEGMGCQVHGASIMMGAAAPIPCQRPSADSYAVAHLPILPRHPASCAALSDECRMGLSRPTESCCLPLACTSAHLSCTP
jgi:hypothetical protein